MAEKGNFLDALNRNKRATLRLINATKDAVSVALLGASTESQAYEVAALLETWRSNLEELKEIVAHITEVTDVKGKTPEQIKILEAKIAEELHKSELEWALAKGKMKTMFARLKAATQPRQSLEASFMAESAPANPMVKLPDIPVPKFSGDIKRFTEWYALFEAMIHSNENLRPVQKLYFLKQAMVGAAEDLLRDYALQEGLYEEAWAAVKNRYYNRRAIIANHFQDLVGFPKITISTLRESLDRLNAIVRGLKVCELNAEAMSPLIAYLVVTKLPERLREEWENSVVENSTYPSFSSLATFLQNRCFAHESVNLQGFSKLAPHRLEAPEGKGRRFAAATIDKGQMKLSGPRCLLCSKEHYISNCPQFVMKDISERMKYVRDRRLCNNCLRQNYFARECNSSKCRKCGGPHHTLLHRSGFSPVAGKETSSSAQAQLNLTEAGAALACTSSGPSIVLLPSAVVFVVVDGRKVQARILLDTCSQVNLVAETFLKKNRIRARPAQMEIACIAQSDLLVNAEVSLSIQSRFNKYRLNLEAEVVGRIPYEVTAATIRRLEEFHGTLQLADCLMPTSAVDILVGGRHASQILLGEKKFIGELCLENSLFGWVAAGPLAPSETVDKQCCNLTAQVEHLLSKFWQVKEVAASEVPPSDYERCEAHFMATHIRLANGQFQVRLPIKDATAPLANTYRQAYNSLLRSENKLEASVRLLYTQFMLEYRELGHMERATRASPSQYFIPHLPVLRPESSTTKLRVVFNAAAKNATGISLNEALLNGPVLQPELFETLVKFRTYKVAFSADVNKMYRRIVVHPEDRSLQTILWRDNPSEDIKAYQLTTVTYGTAPAAFLATKCLQVLAKKWESTHPEIACALASEFYMDDLLTGGETVEEAISKRGQIHAALEEAGFPLRKYVSNSKVFLASITPSLVEELRAIAFSASGAAKILGLQWRPMEDCFCIEVKLADTEGIVLTKRIVSSLIARIFDPLGLIAPVTIRAKLMLQNLWREGKDWDDPVSSELETKFREYYRELQALPNFKVSRCYFREAKKEIELIGFCDTSRHAYGGVVYAFIKGKEGSYATLVCAKTRVAPLKEITIPRLELLGAMLLAKLMARVAEALKFDLGKATVFCDSMVVLAWLKGPSSKYETFVRNRIEITTSILPAQQWRYVKTQDNPADLLTRGVSVQALINNSNWNEGPRWLNSEALQQREEPWLEALPEAGGAGVCHALTSAKSYDEDIIKTFSEFRKLVRVVCLVYRFVRATRLFKSAFGEESEGTEALHALCRMSQQVWFAAEVTALRAEKAISPSSILLGLSPFIDQHGLLRVGGRLRNSWLSYNVKHPIILHRASSLAEALARDAHHSHFHASRAFTLAWLQAKYWIHGGATKLVKKVVGTCVWCAKAKAEACRQIMGELPKERAAIARPFTHSGVDLAGPFSIKCTNHRTAKRLKYYAAFFVCLSTRAVHIEVVTDLTANAFISTLQRFAARRGTPGIIWSDNATNFIGAKGMLERHCQAAGIKWKLIPARSPHQGGIWEAAIKSGKKLLLAAAHGSVLTAEQLTTILAQVEAILNSRPLYRKREVSEPEEIDILTPGHFLVGSNLLDMETSSLESLTLEDRLGVRQNILRSFWRLWSKNYLAQLQSRSKWKSERPNLVVGDLVLLREESDSLKWPLGRMVNVFPDAQGRVRIAEVATKGATVKRAIQKLVRLPIETLSEGSERA